LLLFFSCAAKFAMYELQDGYTALMMASDKKEAFERLLQAGADIKLCATVRHLW
jgi:hypothetical protein